VSFQHENEGLQSPEVEGEPVDAAIAVGGEEAAASSS
jgi:hypothetical protein